MIDALRLDFRIRPNDTYDVHAPMASITSGFPPGFRGPVQVFLLRGGDCRCRGLKEIAGDGPNLGEYDDDTVACDDVQLLMPMPIIALENDEPLMAPQPPLGVIFATSSEPGGMGPDVRYVGSGIMAAFPA